MSMDDEWAKEVSDILQKAGRRLLCREVGGRSEWLNEYQEKALKTAAVSQPG